MELQEIEIVINKKGQVEIHVRGVKGNTCLELTKELEEALGGQLLIRTMTPEAVEQVQPQEIKQNIRGK